jgi:putative transposon-encoded protein
MKKIMRTKSNWINFIKKIRSNFGDDKLYFTFCLFNGKELEWVHTFGSDNIDELNDFWFALIRGRLLSNTIDVVSAVLRIFLPEKIDIDDKRLLEKPIEDGLLSERSIRQFGTEGKITVPKKDLYHFGFTKAEIILFNETETYESQTTDAFTGKTLKHEPGLVYRSSIELYDILMKEYIEIAEHDNVEPLVIDLDDLLFHEPAPEEFTKLKERSLNCTDPEEAFKLNYEFNRWHPDRFDVSEFEDVLVNYGEAVDNIGRIIEDFVTSRNIKNYRDVTHTLPKDLKRMLHTYQKAEIISLGSVKILTWEKKIKKRR